MGVNLQKGQKVSITKENPGLQSLLVGIGWDLNRFDTGGAFDLDSEAFLLTDAGKVSRQEDFIYFGNLKHPSGAVEHRGDNLTGEGNGDDEQVMIDLSRIPEDIVKIVFTVTIYDADNRRQNFGQVLNSFVRIVDAQKNVELLRYDLGEDFSIETSAVFGEIYKHNNEWKFNAIGSGFQGGLSALCAYYGIATD